MVCKFIHSLSYSLLQNVGLFRYSIKPQCTSTVLSPCFCTIRSYIPNHFLYRDVFDIRFTHFFPFSLHQSTLFKNKCESREKELHNCTHYNISWQPLMYLFTFLPVLKTHNLHTLSLRKCMLIAFSYHSLRNVLVTNNAHPCHFCFILKPNRVPALLLAYDESYANRQVLATLCILTFKRLIENPFPLSQSNIGPWIQILILRDIF